MLPAGDRRLGTLAPGSDVRGAVVLRPRNGGALTRFVATVSDPRSAGYGRYLRPGAFASRFGPRAGTRAAVAAALRAQGLRVGRVSADGLIMPFSGTTADAERAFSTQIRAVALAGGGVGRATSSAVTLPSGVTASVTAVIGLDDTVVPHRIASPAPSRTRPAGAPRVTGAAAAAHATGAAGAAGPHACPAAAAAAQADNGLTDGAIAGAYGMSGLYGAGDTGAGQHIAVYELEPFLRSDVAAFDRCYYGAARAAAMLRRLHVVGVDGGPPRGTGSGEASLDVEDLSALAPGASIDVYVGPSANAYDSLDEYAAIVERDRDRVVSTSWGLCEEGLQRGQPGEQAAENLLFQQAAAQGQTVFAAAGDSGSDDCSGSGRSGPAAGQDPVSVDDPASQPYVVGVGGAAVTDATPGHVAEQAWNDGAAYGAGGGGISMSWAMPSWQRAARIPGIARPGDRTYRDADHLTQEAGYAGGFCDTAVDVAPGTPCRLVPDVSAQADEFTGAVTVYSREYATARNPSGWTTTGGTSSAAPIWAASLALINASPACASAGATRDGVGFASPLLYALASDPARYAASFTDVRAGNNDIYGLDQGRVFAAGRGYDPTTGLGSPILSGPDGRAGLATDACTLARPAARPAVTGLAPRSGPSTGATRLTIHGDGFAARGRGRVTGVQVGATRIAADRLRVRGPHTITVTLPAARHGLAPASAATGGGAGTADVLVTLADGATSAPGPRAVFDYLDVRGASARPTVQEVSPAGGFAAGGTAVTLTGTGFAHATGATLGGVAVRRFHVAGPDRISFVTPPRSSRTACVALPRRAVYAGDTAANDICQVYVRVRTAAGLSPRALIRAPAEGPQHVDVEGVVATARGCHCETAQAPDEFDYVPRPHIASVSTGDGPLALADEHGGSVITVRGVGLDPLTLDYADFGAPGRYASEATGYVYATGTELEIRAPRRSVTAAPARVAFSVRSLGGRSPGRAVTYAGVPAITGVVNARSSLNLGGVYGGPDTGGTPLIVHGRGLGTDQVIGVQFLQPGHTPYSIGTQYLFNAEGGRLTTATVAENPAVVTVQPCTVTGCTRAGTGNRFWLYAPGTPTVSAVTPDSGPAAGGTVVGITGQNLGCPLSVSFGTVAATAITPAQTLLPCGSSQALQATAPAGGAGATVPVTVQTAAGFFRRMAPISAGTFTYR